MMHKPAAHLLQGVFWEQMTPKFFCLYWLPIKNEVQCGVLDLTLTALNGVVPTWLKECRATVAIMRGA